MNTPSCEGSLQSGTKLIEAPGVASRPHGILVVDDEPDVRGVLDAALRQQGFAPWVAASGQEALALYQRHRQDIDAVLMDVRMPGLDGPQTLIALKEINPQVHCCFMSGDLGDYTEEDLHELGAAALIEKPFRLAEVGHVLGELVSQGNFSTANP